MRKYYLILFIFLSLTSQIFSQEIEPQQVEYPKPIHLYDLDSSSDGDFLLTTRTRQIWDATSSIWKNDSLVEYSYNNTNLIDTIIEHKWRNGTVWGNDRRLTYIYDTNNYLIELQTAFWYTTNWGIYGRNLYIYNGGNLSRVDLYLTGNYVARSTYQWNYQNYITMLMNEYRHDIYGWWCYGYMYEYIYDSNNKLLRTIEHNGGYCFSWYLYKQKLYTYDGNGNNIEKLSQDWNPTDSTWINDFLYLYEYDNNNFLIQTIYQDWDSDSLEWNNVWREFYTYTPQNSLETTLKETWSSETKWKNHTLRMISYYNEGNWLEDVTQKWDSTSWVNYFRYLATWDEPVSIINDKLNSNNYQLSQNYPNPFNPITTIKYQISELSFVTLKVYDVLGNEVATVVNEEKPTGSYQVKFDASNLSSGIYFYGMRAGDFVDTKKLILLK